VGIAVLVWRVHRAVARHQRQRVAAGLSGARAAILKDSHAPAYASVFRSRRHSQGMTSDTVAAGGSGDSSRAAGAAYQAASAARRQGGMARRFFIFILRRLVAAVPCCVWHRMAGDINVLRMNVLFCGARIWRRHGTATQTVALAAAARWRFGES